MKNEYQENLKVQQNYYDRTAEQYDNWNVDVPSALIVGKWNFDNLKKFIGDKKIERCLDLGCGTGRLSNDLLKISDEVYGVDASQKLLNIAQKKYPNLKLEFGEASSLPYEDNLFDLVVVNGALHHFFALAETCREVNRVLKPGGIFAILGEPNKNYNKRRKTNLFLDGQGGSLV